MESKKDMFFLVRQLDRIMRQNMDAITGLGGHPNLTSMRQLWVISEIMKRNEKGVDVYQRDVEKILGINRSTTSEMLFKMEKNHMIERQPVESDGRLKRIVITEPYKSKIVEIDEAKKSLNEKMIQGLTLEEVDQFCSIMEKLITNMSLD